MEVVNQLLSFEDRFSDSSWWKGLARFLRLPRSNFEIVGTRYPKPRQILSETRKPRPEENGPRLAGERDCMFRWIEESLDE